MWLGCCDVHLSSGFSFEQIGLNQSCCIENMQKSHMKDMQIMLCCYVVKKIHRYTNLLYKLQMIILDYRSLSPFPYSLQHIPILLDGNRDVATSKDNSCTLRNVVAALSIIPANKQVNPISRCEIVFFFPVELSHVCTILSCLRFLSAHMRNG